MDIHKLAACNIETHNLFFFNTAKQAVCAICHPPVHANFYEIADDVYKPIGEHNPDFEKIVRTGKYIT